MKKETIKYTAILLSFATAVVFFASLVKKIDEAKKETAANAVAKTNYSPNENVTETESFYIDENGVYFYNGNELATDENGITLTDDDGNMIQKITDAQGNEETQPVSFPKFISMGNQVACQQFTITLPEGWIDDSSYNLRIKSESEDISVDYSFSDKRNESYVSIDKSIAELESTFQPMVDEGSVEIAKDRTTIAGRDAVKFVIEIKGEYPSYMESYYIETANGTMIFNCFCDPEDKGFDFKAILDMIEYRIK